MTGDEWLRAGADGRVRCWWCGEDPLYVAYHDDEWGRPVAEDVRLFEKLCLEGFQSGLSWLTILRKRENFRAAFAGFEPDAVARFRDADVERLMADAGIVRNRAKILATINNARRAVELQAETGSLAGHLWSFAPDPDGAAEAVWPLPSTTAASKALSRDLKKRGWTFVGPTTAHAFMQAVGMVNDHLTGCDVRGIVERERRRFDPPAC